MQEPPSRAEVWVVERLSEQAVLQEPADEEAKELRRQEPLRLELTEVLDEEAPQERVWLVKAVEELQVSYNRRKF